MFDVQRADPAFVNIVSRLPTHLVQVTGEAMRALATDNADIALALLHECQSTLSNPADPGHRYLSTLQVTIGAVERLRRLGVASSFEQIWNKQTEPVTGARSLREVTVQTNTQQNALQEIQRQLSAVGPEKATCPCCGEKLPPADARAPLLPHDGTLAHLLMYVDIGPVAEIIRQDTGAASISDSDAVQISTALVQRAAITLPVATCTACQTIVLAHPLDPDRVVKFYANSEYHASSAVDAEERVAGTAESFSTAYKKSLFPYWAMNVLKTGVDNKVLDFGCGEGTMLKHFDVAGAKTFGQDLDRQRVAYANTVLNMPNVSDSMDSLEPGSFDLVFSYHTLEHLTDLDRTVAKLCALVAPRGHLLIAVPNGEIKVQKHPDDIPLYPKLGGDHTIALTPKSLSTRLENQGLQPVGVYRSPIDLRDTTFGVDKRDPLSGLPIWSSVLGDFVLVASKAA